MKNILILEDDALLARTLSSSLAGSQTKTAAVGNLETFYQQLENAKYALCVMDRMIGGEDTVEEIAAVRDLQPQIRILMLTRKSQVQDRVKGLESGADDYLAKPFSLAELRLRVRSLLSFSRMQEGNQISFHGLTLFPEQGMLDTPEERISLRRRETEILTCLVQAAGSIVSRERLIRVLWPESYEPNPSTVDVYVRRLRQKLGRYHSVLQTKRGFGYRLVPPDRQPESNAGAFLQP